MKKYTGIFITLYISCMQLCFAQSFEGIITINASQSADTSILLIIKGQKSVMEVDVDSTENFKVIKDHVTESTVLLRQKNEQKYGFRTGYISNDVSDEVINREVKGVIKEITDQDKLIGPYHCSLLKFKTGKAESEAWVTHDLEFPLTKYFPEFLGNHTDNDLRTVANQHGFVMSYSEKDIISGEETTLDIYVEEKEISHEVFSSQDYLVLNEEGMKSLYLESQNDPEKKKQWEEFMELFGN